MEITPLDPIDFFAPPAPVVPAVSETRPWLYLLLILAIAAALVWLWWRWQQPPKAYASKY